MWTALAKLNPTCSLFEKKRRAGFIISFWSLLYLFWGLEMWSGHFNFLIFVILFVFFCFLFCFLFCFSKYWRILLLRRLPPQVPLTYLGLLLREYGRGLFDSDNEMGDGSILMHKVHTHARILKLFYSTHHFAHTPMTMPTIQCSLKNAHWVSDPKCLPM